MTKIIVGKRPEYKLWCQEQNKIAINWCYIMDKRTSKNVVEVCRKNDRII